MPLQLPNLDDRTYDDLVAEALRLIPTHAPEWTNHNPSDPGITLIELFAYLSEMLIYRQNRITDVAQWEFIKLLNGPDWISDQKAAHGDNYLAALELDHELRQAVAQVRDRYRAVTIQDYEELALEASPAVARARCVGRRNLEAENQLDDAVDRSGHISLIVLPQNGTVPSQELLDTVREFLEPRRLLTTRLHVVGPRYVEIRVNLRLHLRDGADLDSVDADSDSSIVSLLTNFFSPHRGGPEGRGWPFGRNVYKSELYRLLDSHPVVDYVSAVSPDQAEIISSPDRRDDDDNHQRELIGIKVNADELVQLRPPRVQILDRASSSIQVQLT